MATPSLEDLAARLASLEEQVQELQQEARVKAVAWMVNRVYEDTQTIRVEMDTRFTAVDRTLAAHGAKLQSLEDRVETGFNAVQGALDEILRELRDR